MNTEDLVRVGPFRGSLKADQRDWAALRWRQRLGEVWTVRVRSAPDRPRPRDSDSLKHLTGIDWCRSLVERPREGGAESWWLPRDLVKLLDAAERAEAQWLQAARTCQGCGAIADRSSRWRVQVGNSWQTICTDCRATTLRAYNGELEGQSYSVLSKRRGSVKPSQWLCAICREDPAFALDHCHEHGYVRAPVCQSCNQLERPDYVHSNDVIAGSRISWVFKRDAEGWLRHWHRCAGCRARNTLPLPHLAALTAMLVGEQLRPTHRDPFSSRGRKPCGSLRASWTGSHNAPGSCVITVSVEFCPTGEHRGLAQLAYREAVDQFRTWLADAAPSVAAAAGPSRLDSSPAQFRPVIADATGEGLALF